MFQGKCKVWREGDEVKASMMLPTPEGPVEWKETIQAEADDPSAERRMENKAAFVAGFFPTVDMVGSEAMEEAEAIYGAYLDPGSRNAALESLEAADHDVKYAINRITGAKIEEIGANFFKKAAKKLKGAAKLNIQAVAFPPLAAYSLVKAARKKKDPKAKAKIRAVAAVANAPLARVAAGLKTDEGKPLITIPPQTPAQDLQSVILPPAVQAKAEEVQAKAQEAYTNLENAAAYVTYEEQAEADASYGDEAYADYEESEDSIGSFYEDGALAGDVDSMSDDQIAGLLDLAKKVGKKARKVGKLIDPTKPGSMTGAALAAVPGLGAPVKASLDLVAKAKAGNKDARDKVKTIRDLAKAGVPKAKDAFKNLKIADNLQNQVEKDALPWWNRYRIPFTFDWYERGAKAA